MKKIKFLFQNRMLFNFGHPRRNNRFTAPSRIAKKYIEDGKAGKKVVL